MGWSEYYDEYTTEFTEHQLEEHDEEIRADERAKIIEKLDKLLYKYEPHCPRGLIKEFEKIKEQNEC